ncbi:hypothetical protein EsDP_00000175 [Epichloe bromicola]|uniref:SP-RING-type domain-containing protein n=1 Tax=Epichloe bromicola TaxID=79588 RepID=A0ABQ0CE48_9HYPO
MSRLLLNRDRLSTAGSSPARGHPASSATLPDYQPPSCTLNDAGRRALGELSHNRGTQPYERQLKNATRQLGLCIGDLHERLGAQQDRLRSLRERRREKGTDKTAEEERLEAHLAELEKDADELTNESEESLRDVIDHQVELQDQTDVLGDLYTDAATASTANVPSTGEPRRRARDQAGAGESLPAVDKEEEEEETPVPVPSTRDTYLAARAQKQAEYEALTPHQRYALNNDYAAFKKIWHDAAAGENGPPLADASRWFRADGRPVMSRPGASSARRGTTDAAADDDDDADDDDEDSDDIAVAREVISLNCPLTLRQMEEPYTHAKCKHTFEKSAIMEYLPARGNVQCPQSGCSQAMSKALFSQDFYPDEVMLRRVQRSKQTQRAIDHMDDDEEDVHMGDESIVLERERRARGGNTKQETS